jgi:zinc finger of C3HC4-type, RING/B-box zinc finger
MAAANSMSVEQQLDDICECPICSGVLDDPRSLPCIHTYCLKCIEEFGKDKHPGDQLSCPLCRKDFAVPERGFSDLPRNFFMNKLIQIKILSSTSADQHRCDVCSANETDPTKRNPATVWCSDCQQKFCDNCSNLHAQMNISRSHSSFRLGADKAGGDIMRKLADPSCVKHPGNVLKMYCFPCSVAICMTCFKEFHHTHRCSDISKIAGEFKQLITHSAKTLAHCVEKNRSFLRKTREATIAFNDAAASVEAQICKRAEEMQRLIEQQKQQLLQEVAVMKQERRKRESHEISELETHISLTDSLMKYADELVKKGTDCDVVREKSRLFRKSEEFFGLDFSHVVNSVGCVELAFVAPSDMTGQNGNLVGKVHVETKGNFYLLIELCGSAPKYCFGA